LDEYLSALQAEPPTEPKRDKTGGSDRRP